MYPLDQTNIEEDITELVYLYILLNKKFLKEKGKEQIFFDLKENGTIKKLLDDVSNCKGIEELYNLISEFENYLPYKNELHCKKDLEEKCYFLYEKFARINDCCEISINSLSRKELLKKQRTDDKKHTDLLDLTKKYKGRVDYFKEIKNGLNNPDKLAEMFKQEAVGMTVSEFNEKVKNAYETARDNVTKLRKAFCDESICYFTSFFKNIIPQEASR